MDTDFSGKVALITGSSSGIGKDTALTFAKNGAKLVLAARRVSEGEELAESIRNNGGDAIFIQTDVSKALDVKTLVGECISKYGRLDYAINNAGIEGSIFVPTADYTEEVFDEVIRTNLKGIWLCMKYEIPEMLKQQKGSIVNMASVAGLTGSPLGCAYHASKHGVIGLTKAAAIEYAKRGIRINAVCPAVIDTPMAERAYHWNEEVVKMATDFHPMGRFGTTKEVAGAVEWLCSDSASYVTGHTLAVDGGFLAQ
jgi:NAD(P)-dependent dehydrogenase (short-subunit alcohol dehydrogenase family)